jgi:hypothetical protein
VTPYILKPKLLVDLFRADQYINGTQLGLPQVFGIMTMLILGGIEF